jgi:hypothetical protein
MPGGAVRGSFVDDGMARHFVDEFSMALRSWIELESRHVLARFLHRQGLISNGQMERCRTAMREQREIEFNNEI